MAGRRLRIWVILGAASLAVFPAGVVWGQGSAELQYESEAPPAESSGLRELEVRVGAQDAALQRKIGEISEVGEELEQVQSRVDGARIRAEELREQTQSLRRRIHSQREAYRGSKAGYEEKARAAYRGAHVGALASVLGRFLGSTGDTVGVGDPLLARVLLDGQESLDAYTEAEQLLENSLRQIS